MLVLHERKSRVTLAARLAGKTAAETISVMLAVFARVDPALRKSITFDNDTAFAQHALLRTMRAMTTWFCDAYASWQKGGVENANGRLRRWLPRQIDIDKVSDEEIQDIVITANLTPRKCLGFRTPLQAILKELGKDVALGSKIQGTPKTVYCFGVLGGNTTSRLNLLNISLTGVSASAFFKRSSPILFCSARSAARRMPGKRLIQFLMCCCKLNGHSVIFAVVALIHVLNTYISTGKPFATSSKS